MIRASRPAVWWLLASALLVAGCGGSGSSLLLRSASRHASPRASAEQLPKIGPGSIPAPPPSGISAKAAAVKVIVGWSRALQRGDVQAAAHYFAQPSEFLNGPMLLKIHTLAQAEAANEALPCGARFLSADQRGRYVNALFRLTSRTGPGGGGCGSGVGQTARTNFLIVGGHILAWIRAPDDPGDNGTPPTAPTPPTPARPPAGAGTPIV